RYEERVPVAEDDEIGELAKSFNAMAAALEDGEARRRRFVADVSHELRTPLSTLGGYVEGLVDGVIEPGEGAWAPMHAETRRMMRLVDDLQQLARAETGRLTLNAAPFAPEEVARLTVEGVRPLFAEKGVALAGPGDSYPSSSLAPGSLRAVGDAQRVAQVLTNLLSNALRYTGQGGQVVVEVGRRGGEAVLMVTDTGAGIPREHLPRVFDRFYRVEAARSRNDGGSGLGLAISKALVEAMGGRIWAESEGPSRGATFSFTLPTGRTEVRNQTSKSHS
ncbi:MAG: HAMP domain-containing sensor histidine kinase, partial [Rubrobacter sp.]